MSWSPYVADVLAHAEAHARSGRVVVAIPCRTKGPKLGGWQRFTPQEGLQSVHDSANRGEQLNLGLVQGHGTAALDFDKKDGKDGEAGFRAWAQTRGHDLGFLDSCSRARTPTGGDHYLMGMPADGLPVPSPQNALDIPGFDVRATGGQIVIAPSWHDKVAAQYVWYQNLAPWQVAEPWPVMPQWLADELRLHHGKGNANGKDLQAPRRQPLPGDTPTRDEFEDKLGKIKRQRTSRSDARKAEDTLKAFDGEAIAPDGGGHGAFVAVTELVARKWPHADHVAIMEYIRPGIEARHALGRRTSFHDVERALISAQTKYAAAAVERETGWRAQLSVTEEGAPKATQANILIILREHDDWHEVFAYNSRTTQDVFERPPPLHGEKESRPIHETDGVALVEWFHRSLGMDAQEKYVVKAIRKLAQDKCFDPVATYFEKLNGKWDGKKRLDTWLVNYMGAEDTPINRLFGRLWLIAGVARTLTRTPTELDKTYGNGPGCKVDTVVVAIGRQGKGKSMTFNALVRDNRWFKDDLSPLQQGKEAKQEIRGPLIVEMSELQVIKQLKLQEQSKSFLTTRSDQYRKPYATDVFHYPRTNIFCGTTNDMEPFRDSTGARRFWPFHSGQCDPVGITKIRDQLWAEAVHEYLHKGAQWHLTPDQEKLAEVVQREFYEVPSFVESIEAWLNRESKKGGPGDHTPAFVCANRVFKEALGIMTEPEKAKNRKGLRDSMVYLGYEKGRVTVSGEKLRGWRRVGATAEEVQAAGATERDRQKGGPDHGGWSRLSN